MATAKRIKQKQPKWYYGHAFDPNLSKKCRVKYQTQIKERGWDDTETWNLDLTLTQFILPRIRRFQDLTIGLPPETTLEEWHICLSKMIAAFNEIINKSDLSTKGKNTNEDIDTMKYKEQEKLIQEGLEIFAKYYCYLWW